MNANLNITQFYDIAVHPADANRVFVGTDVGVYESTNGGDSFTAFSTGLPLGIVVSDLEIDQSPYVLTAGTYSRGAWRVVLAGPVVNQPPTADFTVVAGSGYQASFTDGSIDNDGTVVTRTWNFGDGSPTSNAVNPSHTYATFGTYTITLTVVDDDAATGSYSRTLRFRAPATPLTNGVAVTDQSAAQNDELVYSLAVPSGATNLVFNTTGAAGEDADLSVIFDGEAVCESAGATATETCTIPTPSQGVYTAIVLAFSALTNQNIVGSFTLEDRLFKSGFEQ